MKWNARVGWKGSIWERERERERAREREGGAYVTYVHALVSDLCGYGGQRILLTPCFPTAHTVYPSALAEFATNAFLRTQFVRGSTSITRLCHGQHVTYAFTLLCCVFKHVMCSFHHSTVGQCIGVLVLVRA